MSSQRARVLRAWQVEPPDSARCVECLGSESADGWMVLTQEYDGWRDRFCSWECVAAWSSDIVREMP